jgi:hypothetical protein
MNDLRCGRCNLSRETQDNFCRRCGHQFTVNLPAVTQVNLPAVRRRNRTIPLPLVGSMAVLALGTTAEWAARRLAGSATRALARGVLAGNSKTPTKAQPPATQDVTVDEII